MRNISDEAIKALYKHIMENAGNGNATVVEISEEEYLALSEEEKNNGTMYLVHSDLDDNANTSNPYCIEITQEAYDALPESEKMNGRLFFIKDPSFEDTIKATTIFINKWSFVVKGEIISSALPETGAEYDYYFLLDKGYGVYYKNDKWLRVI